jgi:hypothetical protein
MIAWALLMGGLLATANVFQPAEVVQKEKPRAEFVIVFIWQTTETWQVEIREYQFRQGTLPEFSPSPRKVEAVESQYR